MAKLVGKDKEVVESLDKSLEILQPEETFIEINGEKIFVKPFSFVKLLKALKHLSNLAQLATEGESLGLQQTLIKAFANHGDDILGLLVLSTDKPREYFDEIPADKGLDLAIMAYQVNESFFMKNLFPKIEALLPSSLPQEETETKASKLKKTGSTSSKS